jgi:hypothetical protein
VSAAREAAGEHGAELLEALLAELGAIAEEIVAEVRSELPSFAAVPHDEQLGDATLSLELLIRGSLGEENEPLDVERLDALARRRRAQGIPVEDLVEAWRLAIRIGADHARALAEVRDIPPEQVVASFQGALEVGNQAIARLAAARRGPARAPDRADEEARDLVLAALSGSAPVEELRARASALGLDLSRRYRALRGEGIDDDTRAELARRLGSAEGGLLVATGHGVAGFSAASPDRAGRGLLAVGPEVAFENLPASDRIAVRVLAAAGRFELAGVHDLASAGVLVAVLESGDVGEALSDRYVGPVRAAQGGEELIGSVRAWLDAGMRVAPAAERLHVHPNTLRYRLGRYRELTGADLSVTEEMIGAWWALHRDLLARSTAAEPGETRRGRGDPGASRS